MISVLGKWYDHYVYSTGTHTTHTHTHTHLKYIMMVHACAKPPWKSTMSTICVCVYIGYISHAPPDLGFDDRGVRGGGGGGGGAMCVFT